MAKSTSDLLNRLLKFAARIGVLVDSIPDSRLGRHIAGQLVRSGTSPLPNYAEAQAAESRKDFIHKLKVCLKELRETWTWLCLIREAELLSIDRMDTIIDESDQLCKIMAQCIVTALKKPLK